MENLGFLQIFLIGIYFWLGVKLVDTIYAFILGFIVAMLQHKSNKKRAEAANQLTSLLLKATVDILKRKQGVEQQPPASSARH